MAVTLKLGEQETEKEPQYKVRHYLNTFKIHNLFEIHFVAKVWRTNSYRQESIERNGHTRVYTHDKGMFHDVMS